MKKGLNSIMIQNGGYYTKIRRPVELKYSEEFKTLIEARRKENEVKGWRKEKKLNLINKS